MERHSARRRACLTPPRGDRAGRCAHSTHPRESEKADLPRCAPAAAKGRPSTAGPRSTLRKRTRRHECVPQSCRQTSPPVLQQHRLTSPTRGFPCGAPEFDQTKPLILKGFRSIFESIKQKFFSFYPFSQVDGAPLSGLCLWQDRENSLIRTRTVGQHRGKANSREAEASRQNGAKSRGPIRRNPS